MSDMLNYKGYIGSVLFSKEDRVFHGNVEFVRSLINYEGTDIDSLEAAFCQAVDDYLELCEEQRVTHAAITENKHLNAVLAYAKEIQDKEGPPKSKPAGKQRTRYKPTGRKSPGPKSFVDRHIEARRAKKKMQPQAAPG
jgi:hypothetical protein